MIDGRPDWYRLGEIVMADIRIMNDADKLTFIKALCDMTENAMNPDYTPNSVEGFIGRAINRQYDILHTGIDSYMKTVKANPSGKPKGYPMGSQRVPKTEQEDNVEENVEQIKSQIRTELVYSGYSSSEIENALNSINDWHGIKNKTGYVIQTIKNQRQAGRKRILPAQDFSQRDYTGVDAEMMETLKKEMEQFKREHSERSENV